jgi:hypothetical protein
LQVTVLPWADPNIRPGRWNGERLHPFELRRVPNEFSLWANIEKSGAPPYALNPRHIVGDVAQARGPA